MKLMHKYLGSIDSLTATSTDGKKDYIHPALKNTGCVNLVLIREVISPAIFRNSEEEITDIEYRGQAYVRAVANKFKYKERNRGMQVLRAYGVGGRMPQNRTFLRKKQNPSEAFDLNTLVFGDSTTQDNRVLPVKAAVNYSDALSILPAHLCVDESFHSRAAEDGTLFDAANQKNTDNLFTRHFVKPGTLLVQVLSTQGRVLPPEGLEHLLISIGLAGAYGGQTSVTGTNIRTHFAGMYGDKFERPETSPYELVNFLNSQNKESRHSESDKVLKAIHGFLSPLHKEALNSEEVTAIFDGLLNKFEKDEPVLREQYEKTAKKVGELFDTWFGNAKVGK